jgi:cytochrome P450
MSSTATRPAPAAPPAAAPHPPLLRGRYPGAHALAMARDPLGTIRAVAAFAHGREVEAARFRAGGRTFVVVAHPDLAREVLVTQQRRFVRGYAHRGLRLLLGDGLLTSEGELHRRQRRLAQPAFHRERIAAYARAMTAAAERWDARWQAQAPPGGTATVDVFADMMAVTLAIAGETLFGAQVEGTAADVSAAMTDVLRAAPLVFFPLARHALVLPIPIATRYRAARARLDAVVFGIIAERRRARAAGEAEGDDLLAMLLDATDPEDPGATPMSDAQLRDEVMTLFLAGHETTAAALTWTWVLLATAPDAEARLHAELDAVLGRGAAARAPTFDDLPRLPYTRMVLAEAMRLRPPAYAVGRLCTERTTVGGFTIEPGWGVVTSPWLVHHDARWWPEPERFLPERWATEDAERPRLAYFPFGAGPRLCIGEQFAWTEAMLVLATLARRWRVRVAEPGAVGLRGAITLRPSGAVSAEVERR